MKRIHDIRQIMSNSLTRKWLLATILLTTMLLTAGYLLGKQWLQAPVVFLLGILWAVCVLRDIRWIASLLFLVLIGATAVGYMANLSHILMLAAGVYQRDRLGSAPFRGRLLDLDEPATKEMEKQHLLRALMVFGISFLLIVTDSLLRVRIQFIVLVFVTVLIILVLNQTMILVRKAGKPAPPKE